MKKKFMMLFVCVMAGLSACGKASNEENIREVAYEEEYVSSNVVEQNSYEEECASGDVGEQVLVTENEDTDYSGMYTDKQGTSSIYSELVLIRQEDGSYKFEMGLYRLTTISGIATADENVLHFTGYLGETPYFEGDIVIEGESATATFTNSTWELIKNGRVFRFPSEKLEVDEIPEYYLEPFLDETVEETTSTENHNQDEEIELYVNVLQEYIAAGKTDIAVSFIDLDDDNTEEMIVFFGESQTDGCCLFTIKNAEAIQVVAENGDFFGQYGGFTYKEKGNVFVAENESVTETQISNRISYYAMEHGKAVCKDVTQSITQFDSDETKFYVNDTEVDSEKFNSIAENYGLLKMSTVSYSEGVRVVNEQIDMVYDAYYSNKLLDLFINGSIDAVDAKKLTSTLHITDFNMDTEEWDSSSVGERVDLDNDGESELIICGPYGGIYLDARDNKVYKFAAGDGNANRLSYTYYNGEIWILYSNSMNSGYEAYYMEKYEGADNLVAEMSFGEEPVDANNPESGMKYLLNGKEISYEEYSTFCSKIFAAEVTTN